jgi:hypothetical protein
MKNRENDWGNMWKEKGKLHRKKESSKKKSHVSQPATMADTTIGLLLNGYERKPEEQVRQRGKH